MLRYLEVDGVDLKGIASPIIEKTPEGEAMGHVPGWVTMIDPDYIELPSGLSAEDTTLNRANGQMMPTSRSSASVGLPEKIQDLGSGQTLVQCLGDAYLQMVGNAGIDPTNWSVAAVLRGEERIRPRNYIVRSTNSNDDLSLAIAYSGQTGEVRVYEYGDNVSSGGPTRIVADTPLLANDLTLVVVTFSAIHGLKVFVNGALAAENADDRRPLVSGYGAGDYQWFSFFRGEFGVSCALNTDLGAPRNAGYRRAIERFLMTKYGISA